MITASLTLSFSRFLPIDWLCHCHPRTPRVVRLASPRSPRTQQSWTVSAIYQPVDPAVRRLLGHLDVKLDALTA